MMQKRGAKEGSEGGESERRQRKRKGWCFW